MRVLNALVLLLAVAISLGLPACCLYGAYSGVTTEVEAKTSCCGAAPEPAPPQPSEPPCDCEVLHVDATHPSSGEHQQTTLTLIAISDAPAAPGLFLIDESVLTVAAGSPSPPDHGRSLPLLV